MARIIPFLRFTFLLLSGTTLFAQTDTAMSEVSPPEVKIAGTQFLSITSAITNEKYDLYVNLPRGYGDTSKIFPVVYLLDGQWDFPLVESIYGSQFYDGFIPGMVVVGITCSGANANYDSLRAGDLTPSPTKEVPQGGGAPKFLQFIKTELIPLIESKYRVDRNDRTLLGTSLGGLFTLYTIFNETTLFNRYILTSPALTWDNGIIYKYEKTFAGKDAAIPARVFMGIGEYEDVPTFQKFVQLLKSRHYRGLSLEAKVLNGVGHSGTKALGYTWGLQTVFARVPFHVDRSILVRYTGSYKDSAGAVYSIALDHDHLVFTNPAKRKLILHSVSNKEFYVVGSYMLICSANDSGDAKDETGKFHNLRLESYYKVSTLERFH